MQWHWLEKWLYFRSAWSWPNSWWTKRYLKTESIPDKEEICKAENKAASLAISLPNLEENGEEIRKAENKTASSAISLPNLKEKGEEICKAENKAASSAISLPNLEEDGEEIRKAENKAAVRKREEEKEKHMSIDLNFMTQKTHMRMQTFK